MTQFNIHDIKMWRELAHLSGCRASIFAKKLKISQRQLQRYSQEVFEKSPQVWLNDQRLIAAAELLMRERSVKIVASGLGYMDVSHFCHQFKRRYKVSATQYLAQMSALDNKWPPETI